jgi:hypothetical protein
MYSLTLDGLLHSVLHVSRRVLHVADGDLGLALCLLGKAICLDFVVTDGVPRAFASLTDDLVGFTLDFGLVHDGSFLLGVRHPADDGEPTIRPVWGANCVTVRGGGYYAARAVGCAGIPLLVLHRVVASAAIVAGEGGEARPEEE